MQRDNTALLTGVRCANELVDAVPVPLLYASVGLMVGFVVCAVPLPPSHSGSHATDSTGNVPILPRSAKADLLRFRIQCSRAHFHEVPRYHDMPRYQELQAFQEAQPRSALFAQQAPHVAYKPVPPIQRSTSTLRGHQANLSEPLQDRRWPHSLSSIIQQNQMLANAAAAAASANAAAANATLVSSESPQNRQQQQPPQAIPALGHSGPLPTSVPAVPVPLASPTPVEAQVVGSQRMAHFCLPRPSLLNCKCTGNCSFPGSTIGRRCFER
jgi:hypothetical protein